ncbi:hypothetical protein E2K73_07840 [Acinetobacter sp. RF15A]|uniref:hypothetical protein n=1 Tax=unclassified Acinetobacter TaxID=196816 RepID=UPI00118EEA9E|nr:MULTISPECIES: hypothetical protein [unclassified Acinetobacter]QKQ69905.1 hypothetical protein E5Y90_06505 [Acinetobacter sp. 10FS3-1]TSH74912.1 hypothetical protein E2K73_07840 [Acinetobacter sp. RF15A]TSI20391.1 hypothetical protein E2K74_02865 [Acinetobacter sp. RF15B]
MHNGIALDKAREYYDIMQVMYGHKFISQFNGMTDLNRILNIINGALAMLSDEQFQKGMAQLNAKAGSGDFCPTLSDFKTWCMSGSWWTATEAWQRACDYSNMSSHRVAELSRMKLEEFLMQKDKITTLTKKAWDSVYWLVEQGSMKEAFKQFKSIYETYLAKAQMQGRQQEWYVPPKMIATSKAAPKPKSILPEQSPEQKAWLEGKIKELQSSGMTFPMAMYSAMKEMQSAGGGV